MRRLVQVIGFLVITATLYGFAMLILSRWQTAMGPLIYHTADYYVKPQDVLWKQLREFNPETRYDAVIVGSSHAGEGYNPAVFKEHGFKAYTLGTAGQTPLSTYLVLKQHLDSTNTGLVIFDMYERMFELEGMEGTAALIMNHPSDLLAFKAALGYGGIRAWNMFCFRIAKGESQGIPPRTANEVKNHFYYWGSGYYASTDSTTLPIRTNRKNKPFKLDHRQDVYFRKCLAYCIQREIPVVLSQHYIRKGMDRGKHPAFVSYLEHATAVTGIPFLDYSFAPGVDQFGHFYDNGHLNTAGARIFTEQLVDSLERLGYLHKRE